MRPMYIPLKITCFILCMFCLVSCSKQKDSLKNKVKENKAYIWQQKGVEYFAQDKFDKAIECHDKAINQMPALTTAYYGKGEALYYLKRYDEAEKAFQKVVEIEPDNTDGWYMLSMVYLETRKGVKAKKVFLKLDELDPEVAEKMVEVYNAYLKKWEAEENIQY